MQGKFNTVFETFRMEDYKVLWLLCPSLWALLLDQAGVLWVYDSASYKWGEFSPKDFSGKGVHTNSHI